MRARLSRQVRQRVCARRGGGAGDALDREEEVLRLPGAVCKTCSLPRGVLDCPIGSLTTRNEGLYRGQNAQRQLHRARRGLRYGALADKQLIGLGRIVRGECPLIRGLDQYRTANGKDAITALGTALVDCGGGDSDRPFTRAKAFHALGYRAAVVRDDDKEPTAAIEDGFIVKGGKVIAWRDGRALEDELFQSLSDDGVKKLLARAIELHGDDLVNEHIKSASKNARDLATILAEAEAGGISPESRTALGAAARTKRAGWFKSVTWMEDAARDIVGPDLPHAETGFRDLAESIFGWCANAGI